MEDERETNRPEHLLGQSKLLLRQQDFSGCRKFALQALQSDPNLAAADQILAVADVLLAANTNPIYIHDKNGKNPNPNYYSILRLSPLTQDSKLIREHFKNLVLLVCPSKNRLSFAKEAFTLVCEAWSVLSNPSKKARFDNDFRRSCNTQHRRVKEDDKNRSFWTVCPYCYYLYEYEIVYVDCCLRCRNCRRPFHGAAIPSRPPRVPGKDEYYCRLGVFQFGYSCESEKGVGGKNGATEGDEGGIGGGGHVFVEISDDSDEEEIESRKKINEGALNVGTKKLEAELGNCDEGEKVMVGIRRIEVEEERPKKRRKTVAKCAKKIMGTGRRVEMIESVHLNVEAEEGEEGSGIRSIGEMGSGIGKSFVINGMEYFEGEDDILVSLPIVDDGVHVNVQASS